MITIQEEVVIGKGTAKFDLLKRKTYKSEGFELSDLR